MLEAIGKHCPPSSVQSETWAVKKIITDNSFRTCLPQREVNNVTKLTLISMLRSKSGSWGKFAVVVMAMSHRVSKAFSKIDEFARKKVHNIPCVYIEGH